MLIGFLLCFCRSDTRDSTVINTERRRVCIITRETLDSHITRHRVSNCAPVTRHTDGEQRAINHSKLKFVASTPDPFGVLRSLAADSSLLLPLLLFDSLTSRNSLSREKCPLDPLSRTLKSFPDNS